MTTLRDELRKIHYLVEQIKSDPVCAMDFVNAYSFYGMQNQFPFSWRGCNWDKETAVKVLDMARAAGRNVSSATWWESYQWEQISEK